MTETDENINSLLQTVEQFYKDISLLLQSADSLVQKHGLKPTDNKAFQILSALDAPAQWQPSVFFRYYVYERKRNWLPFISVISGNPEKGVRLARPLASAGWYEFEKKTDYFYDFAAAHLWAKGALDDGTPATMQPSIEWKNYHRDATKATSLAVPLVTTKNTQDLESKIVYPLIKLMESN